MISEAGLGSFGIGVGNESSGCINGRKYLDQLGYSHGFYRTLTSGIIHSLDYLHNSVFKIKSKLGISGMQTNSAL
jgi:hypothetical protein